MMQVSFGKKIPIMHCSIKDTEKCENVPAIISEYDCKTSEDAQDIMYMGSSWHFRIDIAADMLTKYKQENFHDKTSPYHFYIMENTQGKPVALCETVEEDNEINVKYIESERNYEHKYCGKTMLAALGKKLLKNNGSRLVISHPIPKAYDFYVKGCGFKKMKDNAAFLEMNPKQVDKFISKTELQSGGEIS